MTNAWKSFQEGPWTHTLDVRDFIQKNVTPYDGDSSFLAPPTQRTRKLWAACQELLLIEQAKGGVLDVDTHTVTGINAHAPGYIDRDLEIIVGLQTDAPLKRAVNPYGGIRMTEQACQAYGYKLDPEIHNTFSCYRRTHNEGVFAAYTDEMKTLRKAGVITGLPDAYGRGRIIGDYRRLPLYGAQRLIAEKQGDLFQLSRQRMSESIIRLREEIHNQIQALEELINMASAYGYNVARPAGSSREAFQWLYFAYLAAVKEQNGAAMSLGRISTFLDIYIQRDVAAGTISEAQAQELMDQLVIKLRLVRQLRTPEYNELFAGDPVWITEAIGGLGLDGQHLVTRSSYRILHTLTNLGPAPEPNLTILWSEHLPKAFKKYCARMTMESCALQYENDDIMRPRFGDDYGIACCVSAMALGKQMQFFGARCNLPKVLLLAINGGRDESTGEQIGPVLNPLGIDQLSYELVKKRLDTYLDWLSQVYTDTMNIIHFMHDKYAYESLQMAFHDTQVKRSMAFGIAGLSVIADSLSAIRYGTVQPIMNEKGLIASYQISGDVPRYGNDDDRADQIAAGLVAAFAERLEKQSIYRGAEPTLSVLTITSNVVYGQKTGDTPDGRKAGEPFAPGANPMHGRDRNGALAALNSMAKIPYDQCLDGVSCTFSVIPRALGRDTQTRASNLIAVLDGYFQQKAHHININVLDRSTLQSAMAHPDKYPQLTIRVSGYAVHFSKLSHLQQQEVLARTFHAAL
jgi:formate C-acetyltransferase